MKKVDITSKLSFDESPCLVIKGKDVAVKTDAPTLLKIMDLMMGEGGPGMTEILKAYDLLFDEKSRKTLDGFKLSLTDLSTVIMEAMNLVMDTGEGELGEQ